MALFDFLKRKKEIEKSKPTQKVEKASVAKKPEGQKPVKVKEPAKAVGKFSYTIIKEPHISEKASILAQSNKYVFKVYDNANKPEIKRSLEGMYGVQITDVKIINIPKKKRRLGRTEGFKKGFSKAIVTVKEGQKIEVF